MLICRLIEDLILKGKASDHLKQMYAALGCKPSTEFMAELIERGIVI